MDKNQLGLVYQALIQLNGGLQRSDALAKYAEVGESLDFFSSLVNPVLQKAVAFQAGDEFRIYSNNSGAAATSSTTPSSLFVKTNNQYTALTTTTAVPPNTAKNATQILAALQTGSKAVPAAALYAEMGVFSGAASDYFLKDDGSAMAMTYASGTNTEQRIRTELFLAAAVSARPGSNPFDLAGVSIALHDSSLKFEVVDHDGAPLSGAIAVSGSPAVGTTAWTDASGAVAAPYALKVVAGAASASDAVNVLSFNKEFIQNLINNIPTTMKSDDVRMGAMGKFGMSSRVNALVASQFYLGQVVSGSSAGNLNTDTGNANAVSAAYAQSALSGTTDATTMAGYFTKTGGSGDQREADAITGLNGFMAYVRSNGATSVNYAKFDLELDQATLGQGAKLTRGIYRAAKGTGLYQFGTWLNVAERDGVVFTNTEYTTMVASITTGSYEKLDTSTGIWGTTGSVAISSILEAFVNKYDEKKAFSEQVSGQGIADYLFSQASVPTQSMWDALSANVLSKAVKLEIMQKLANGQNILADAAAIVYNTPAVLAQQNETLDVYTRKALLAGTDVGAISSLGRTASTALRLIDATLTYLMTGGMSVNGITDMKGFNITDVPGLLRLIVQAGGLFTQESSGSTDPNDSNKGIYSLVNANLLLSTKDTFSVNALSMFANPETVDAQTSTNAQDLDNILRVFAALRSELTPSADRLVLTLATSFGVASSAAGPNAEELSVIGKALNDGEQDAWIKGKAATVADGIWGLAAAEAEGAAEARLIANTTTNSDLRRNNARNAAKTFAFKLNWTVQSGDFAPPAWSYVPASKPTVDEMTNLINVVLNESSVNTVFAATELLQISHAINVFGLGAALSAVEVEKINYAKFNAMIKAYVSSSATNCKPAIFKSTGNTAITSMATLKVNINPTTTSNINTLMNNFVRPASNNAAWDLATALVFAADNFSNIFPIALVANTPGEVAPENVRLSQLEIDHLNEVGVPTADQFNAAFSVFEQSGYAIDATPSKFVYRAAN